MWAALELDDAQTGEYNTLLWPDFAVECLAHGIKPGVWFTEGGNITRTPVDAHFSIAEVEGPGDYNGVVAAIDAGTLPDCPLAVVTNFNVPLTTPAGAPAPAAARPLIDAGFFCLTEAYLGDNPNATPDELDFKAKQLGWATSQPVFGVWNAPPSAYAQWADWPGADYLGEYVL